MTVRGVLHRLGTHLFWLFEVILLKSFVDVRWHYQSHIFEVTMVDHVSTCDPLSRVKYQHQPHQIHETFTPRLQHTLQSQRTLVLLISQTQLNVLPMSCRPVLFPWLAQNIKNFMKLINIISSRKQRCTQVQLHCYTGQREDINGSGVLLGSEQVLRCPVPSRCHVICRYFMSGYGQTKIYQFDFCRCFVNEYVLRFNISVYDTSLVDVSQAQGCLEKNAFDLFFPQSVPLLLVEFQSVLGEVLEGHPGLARGCILLEVEHLDDIGMFKTFEEVGLFECDILMCFHDFESGDLVGVVLSCGVDGAEVAVANFFQNFVFAIYLHLYFLLEGQAQLKSGWTGEKTRGDHKGRRETVVGAKQYTGVMYYKAALYHSKLLTKQQNTSLYCNQSIYPASISIIFSQTTLSELIMLIFIKTHHRTLQCSFYNNLALN